MTASPAASQHATEMAKSPDQHFPVLDGLRGVAILVVLVHNATFIETAPNSLPLKLFDAVAAGGWAGVQLFFVLSGFLITGILLRTRGRSDYYRQFYLRRTLRIFPLYYAVLLGAFLIVPHWIPPGEWRTSVARYQVWYWTYLSNWASIAGGGIVGLTHFWSLAVEEQFYLVWPAIVGRVKPLKLGGICLGLLVLAPMVRWLWPEGAYHSTVSRADGLAAGALLALAWRDHSWGARLRRYDRRLLWSCALGMLILAGVRHGFQADDRWVSVIGQSLLTGACAVLVWWGVDQAAAPAGFERALTFRAVRLCGKYSYAMYVFHYPLHKLLSPYLSDWVNTGGAAGRIIRLAIYLILLLLLTGAAAVASWHLLEKRFLALKDRMALRPLPYAA